MNRVTLVTDPAALLGSLRARGVDVQLIHDLVSGAPKLQARPSRLLTDSIRERLREHRDELIDLLTSCRAHINPTLYRDEPAEDRPGWIRTTCRMCGKLLGHRPIKESLAVRDVWQSNGADTQDLLWDMCADTD